MAKYLLEFDPKYEPNRLKFYSSKFPNGFYFTEEKTKRGAQLTSRISNLS